MKFDPTSTRWQKHMRGILKNNNNLPQSLLNETNNHVFTVYQPLRPTKFEMQISQSLNTSANPN
jgi:hypothetical protein